MVLTTETHELPVICSDLGDSALLCATTMALAQVKSGLTMYNVLGTSYHWLHADVIAGALTTVTTVRMCQLIVITATAQPVIQVVTLY